MPESLLNCQQVADRLNISARLARDLMQDMHPVAVGRGNEHKSLRVHAGELERWIHARTQYPERIKPERRKPKRTNRTDPELTPGGRMPYRHDGRKKT